MTISNFHLQPKVAVIPYKYQPPLKPFSHTISNQNQQHSCYKLTMKAQKYCFYLFLLSLLILPIYATDIGGKPSVRDKHGWKPIKNIKDPYVKGIADFALFESNKRFNFNLLFKGVLRGQTRSSNGTYFRLVVVAKNGAHTRNYRTVVFEQPWADLRKLVYLTAFNRH